LHTDQDAVLRRITEALTTPSDLQKALVVDESCVDFIVKSILEVISVVSDIKILMFLNASRESSIQKGRRYGLIKDNSDVKVADYDEPRCKTKIYAHGSKRIINELLTKDLNRVRNCKKGVSPRFTGKSADTR
jgi:hypothetical protein